MRRRGKNKRRNKMIRKTIAITCLAMTILAVVFWIVSYCHRWNFDVALSVGRRACVSVRSGTIEVWYPYWASHPVVPGAKYLSGYSFSIEAASLVVLAGVYPMLYWVFPRQVREYRRRKGLCVKCGYDHTGNVSGACPECGSPI